MISRYTYKDLIWVDVQSPTHDEARLLMEEFNIHPLVAEELLSPTIRPKVDLYHDLIYLILHFPTISHKHDGGQDQEIDFIIGKKFIITAHYGLVDQLHEFSKIFEVNSILDRSNIGDHAGFILFYLLKDLYKMLDGELDHINHDFKEIQSKIFSGKERDMVNAISHINRDLLNFKQIVRPHKEVLESFEIAGKKFFGEEFSYYLRTITGEFYKISSILDGHRETVLDLRDTNDSLLTTKTNDIMKLLTIMSFTILPLSFVASLFGMNAINMPIIGEQYDFWIIICGLTVMGVILLTFFRFRKWL
ncbi:MAG: magnesium transporter CorA family protein [Minisyncoccia bacterium]